PRGRAAQTAGETPVVATGPGATYPAGRDRMADRTPAATARLASASGPTGGAPTAEGRNRTSSSSGVNAGPLPRPKGRANAGSTARAPRVFAASGRAARGQ